MILFKVVAHPRRFSQYFLIGLGHNYILCTLYVFLMSAADNSNNNQLTQTKILSEKDREKRIRQEMPTAITPCLIFRLAARIGLVTQLHLYHGHRGAQQQAKQVLTFAVQGGMPKDQFSYSFLG